ncbi:MAG TPA: DUF177 domain-containing protein [Solirubrobacteraceae bacterium]|jgi:uncharacterized protein|nr:DUF177 domain-containing protein [Solirubrobacteraceae bacterium]
MTVETRELDLASLRLSPGEGRRLELRTPIDELLLAGEPYRARPLVEDGDDGDGATAQAPDQHAHGVPVKLTVSRMSGGGYALALAFSAAVAGPCMRCLKAAAPRISVEAREVDVPGEGEELDSPYVHDETLALGDWAHDAFALALPAQILCREDCAGLCPVCAVDLNEAGSEHHHEAAPDPRWAKLRELKIG